MSADYQGVLKSIALKLKGIKDVGSVPTYIPELSKVHPNKFGIHLTATDCENYSYGDSDERFSIQSISKVFSLTLAFSLERDKLWNRVGVEPSGSAFNSLVQLEYENGIPRNPFINAGALVICDVLMSQLKNPKADLLNFTREISGNSKIDYCPRVAHSEWSRRDRNAALIHLMKDFGNIRNKTEDVLDFYFHLCSIEMSCKELAQAFLFLANKGIHPLTNKKIISSSQSKRINAVMLLCGFYDEAGEFAFKVGLPGKSGVGGGIIAIHPGQYSVAVWSPKLNQKGNSHKGMKVLELLTTHTQSSIF